MMQKTLKEKIAFSGIGLHTGEEINVEVLPAPADSGITFLRTDFPESEPIRAHADNVISTNYATTLGKGNATVSTVEHLMASFYCLGIDNATVLLDGGEVPIMDGSSAEFIERIEEAGIARQNAPKRYIVIKKPIKVVNGSCSIQIMPSDDMELSVDYRIDFTHPYLTKQSFSNSFTKELFVREVASARTFGFLNEVEMLKEMGLAKGGCLSNAVVIGEHDVLNEEGLRFPDEPVRHKVLDLMGDLALLGAPLIGRVVAYRSGHALNHKLAEKILSRPAKWEFVDPTEIEVAVEPAQLYEGSLMIA